MLAKLTKKRVAQAVKAPEGSGVVRINLGPLDRSREDDEVAAEEDEAAPRPFKELLAPVNSATLNSASPPAAKPVKRLGFRTSAGVLEAIRKYGRCYTNEEVIITFGELVAIDSNVGTWLSGLRAEGSITYEGPDELAPGMNNDVFIAAPTRETKRWRGAATDTPRGQSAPLAVVDPGINQYVLISAK